MPLRKDNSFLDHLTKREREIVMPNQKGRRPMHEVIEEMVPKAKPGRPAKKGPESKPEWE